MDVTDRVKVLLGNQAVTIASLESQIEVLTTENGELQTALAKATLEIQRLMANADEVLVNGE